MALPPQHRLQGHRVFDRLYRQGRRLHSELMVLRVLTADQALLPPGPQGHAPSDWRFGVVVSTKVHKRAVRRNRLRRLLQESLLHQPLNCPTPQWLLLSLKPGSADADPAQLLGEWRQLLRKAGLCP
ncbi:MAG: ribonuclease P protein component [Cyanobacteria bacterium]|nr:ribonuclease P protein component [Cyanobacteriota bacterium]